MQMEPLPTPRSSAMATTSQGKLWVLGGTSGTRRATPGHVAQGRGPKMLAFDSFHSETGAFEQNTEVHVICEEKAEVALALHMGALLKRRLRSVDVFDPRANRWETLKGEMVDVRSAGQAQSNSPISCGLPCYSSPPKVNQSCFPILWETANVTGLLR